MSSADEKTGPASDQSASPLIPEDESLVITLPDDSSSPRDLALWAGFLVILTFIAYWPVTDGKFLRDDDKNVSRNYLLAQPGGLAKMWTQRWSDPKGYPLPQYHPTAFTSYWMDYKLFGHETSGTPTPTPFAFHFTNLLLHAVAVVLVWLVLRKLKLPGAWLAAAVFALHPINTESVAWITQRASVLAGALFFGSIYAYLLFVDDDDLARAQAAGPSDAPPVDPARQWGLYAGSLALFVLAMLSKAPAFAMPFVMLLLLWWKRRLSPRQLALLAPFMLIAVALAFTAADFERDFAGANGREWQLDAGQRSIVAGRAIWFYLAKLIVPVRLAFMYPKWSPDSQHVLQFLPLVGAVVFFILLAVGQKRLGRGPLVAMAAFVLCLFPSLGFFNLLSMRFSFVADHYAYLAAAPVIALIIAAGAKAVQRAQLPQSRAATVVGLSAILLIVLGSATWARTHVFAAPLNLWQDTVAKNPDFPFVRDEYANELGAKAEAELRDGDTDGYAQDIQEALDQVRRATELNPSDAQAEWIWGRLLSSQKKMDEAVFHLARATELRPTMVQAWQDLAGVLIAQKHFPEAITKLDNALRVSPNSSTTHRLLAQAYAGLGDSGRAIAEDRQAIRINPDDLLAHEDLGNFLAKTGRDDKEALYEFTVVLQSQRTRADLWNKVGILYAARGTPTDLKTAIAFFTQAWQLDPLLIDAQKNINAANAMLDQLKAHAATMPGATRPSTAPILSPATQQ